MDMDGLLGTVVMGSAVIAAALLSVAAVSGLVALIKLCWVYILG